MPSKDDMSKSLKAIQAKIYYTTSTLVMIRARREKERLQRETS